MIQQFSKKKKCRYFQKYYSKIEEIMKKQILKNASFQLSSFRTPDYWAQLYYW